MKIFKTLNNHQGSRFGKETITVFNLIRSKDKLDRLLNYYHFKRNQEFII